LYFFNDCCVTAFGQLNSSVRLFFASFPPVKFMLKRVDTFTYAHTSVRARTRTHTYVCPGSCATDSCEPNRGPTTDRMRYGNIIRTCVRIWRWWIIVVVVVVTRVVFHAVLAKRADIGPATGRPNRFWLHEYRKLGVANPDLILRVAFGIISAFCPDTKQFGVNISNRINCNYEISFGVLIIRNEQNELLLFLSPLNPIPSKNSLNCRCGSACDRM
jgi:hypothetical protein